MERKQSKGLIFDCREDTSDIKAVNRVVGTDLYQKRGMRILPGEKWLDLGANIGAFACRAASLGATVDCYECDPVTVQYLRDNVALNKLGGAIKVIHEGVTDGDTPGLVPFHVSPTNQFWRNSMVSFGKGKIIMVKVVPLQSLLKNGVCVKMNIEGMEMPILEKLDFSKCSKLVFEWSFDNDPHVKRYHDVLDRMTGFFDVVKGDRVKGGHKLWPKTWFPPCKLVYCWNTL